MRIAFYFKFYCLFSMGQLLQSGPPTESCFFPNSSLVACRATEKLICFLHDFQSSKAEICFRTGKCFGLRLCCSFEGIVLRLSPFYKKVPACLVAGSFYKSFFPIFINQIGFEHLKGINNSIVLRSKSKIDALIVSLHTIFHALTILKLWLKNNDINRSKEQKNECIPLDNIQLYIVEQLVESIHQLQDRLNDYCIVKRFAFVNQIEQYMHSSRTESLKNYQNSFDQKDALSSTTRSYQNFVQEARDIHFLHKGKNWEIGMLLNREGRAYSFVDVKCHALLKAFGHSSQVLSDFMQSPKQKRCDCIWEKKSIDYGLIELYTIQTMMELIQKFQVRLDHCCKEKSVAFIKKIEHDIDKVMSPSFKNYQNCLNEKSAMLSIIKSYETFARETQYLYWLCCKEYIVIYEFFEDIPGDAFKKLNSLTKEWFKSHEALFLLRTKCRNPSCNCFDDNKEEDDVYTKKSGDKPEKEADVEIKKLGIESTSKNTLSKKKEFSKAERAFIKEAIVAHQFSNDRLVGFMKGASTLMDFFNFKLKFFHTLLKKRDSDWLRKKSLIEEILNRSESTPPLSMSEKNIEDFSLSFPLLLEPIVKKGYLDTSKSIIFKEGKLYPNFEFAIIDRNNDALTFQRPKPSALDFYFELLNNCLETINQQSFELG